MIADCGFSSQTESALPERGERHLATGGAVRSAVSPAVDRCVDWRSGVTHPRGCARTERLRLTADAHDETDTETDADTAAAPVTPAAAVGDTGSPLRAGHRFWFRREFRVPSVTALTDPVTPPSLALSSVVVELESCYVRWKSGLTSHLNAPHVTHGCLFSYQPLYIEMMAACSFQLFFLCDRCRFLHKSRD